jgi:hypothetical protein
VPAEVGKTSLAVRKEEVRGDHFPRSSPRSTEVGSTTVALSAMPASIAFASSKY